MHAHQLPSATSTDNIVNATLSHYNIGSLISPAEIISSGLTNTVFDIETTKGRFVLKAIDSHSPRARSLHDYEEIERLERCLQSEIPVVLAKRSHFCSVFEYDEKYILIFPYVNNSKQLGGPVGPVEPSRAYEAGELLGKIHQEQQGFLSPRIGQFKPHLEYQYLIDFNALVKISGNPEMQNFFSIAQHSQSAYQRLRSHMVYSHGDYQPHNLLLAENELFVIDWELAGLINPDMECMIGCITFSGYATDEFNEQALRQFFHGYQNSGCYLKDNLDDVIWAALHKCWVNWIYFNLQTNHHEIAYSAFQGLTSMIAKVDDLKSRITELQIEWQYTICGGMKYEPSKFQVSFYN